MLIGLTGRAQAGKDTVYARCLELYSPRLIVERRSFADLLYRSAAAALGVSEHELREVKADPSREVALVTTSGQVTHSCSVRQYLQRYGTEAHRDLFGDDFWVDHLDLSHDPDAIVFVTDVRFDNEAQAIIDAGGCIVQVIGPETADDAHRSESGVDPDLVLGTLDNSQRGDGFERLDLSTRALMRVIGADG